MHLLISKRLLGILLLLLITLPSIAQSKQEEAILHALNARTVAEIEQAPGKFTFKPLEKELLSNHHVMTTWLLYKNGRLMEVELLTVSLQEIIYAEAIEIKEHGPHKVLGKRGSLKTGQRDHLAFPDRSYFSFACGIGADMSPEAKQMLVLVRKNDKAVLQDWLESINPVRQAYAFIGFKLLESREVGIEPDIQEKMKAVLEWKWPIPYCYGCVNRGPQYFHEIWEQWGLEPFEVFLKRVENRL